MSAKKIRIIAVPPGEAPEYIRQAWVGVVIPLPPPPLDQKRSIPSAGVLSGPKTPLGQMSALVRGKGFQRYGYTVEAIDAVEALAKKDAKAAEWWQKNASFRMKKGQMFVFAADVCEEVVET
jgi:hypothetical protein